VSDLKNIEGSLYPEPHPAWGGFAEELFHYTSRYYCTTESFLRAISGDREFSMDGYSAARLSDAQRAVLAAVLAQPPDAVTARAVAAIVRSVIDGVETVDPALARRFLVEGDAARPGLVEHHAPAPLFRDQEIDPLDPFLHLAERLQLPVAPGDRVVEVDMAALAGHLDTANAVLRTNLQNAIIALHTAGRVLRNHPHLTHAEADVSARGQGTPEDD
jgi:hypothetical protein